MLRQVAAQCLLRLWYLFRLRCLLRVQHRLECAAFTWLALRLLDGRGPTWWARRLATKRVGASSIELAPTLISYSGPTWIKIFIVKVIVVLGG